MFACVTVDAKLQIWDLSVSSIDPVVSLDIGAEDLAAAAAAAAAANAENGESGDGMLRSPSDHLHSLPASPAIGTRFGSDRYDPNNANNNINNGLVANANATPVTKLLKSLAIDPKKRILTTVQFGENNPIIAVGDNRGNVTVYRVFDPITITNLGPLQQFLKLKEVILRQTDPQYASLLEADYGGYSNSNTGTTGSSGTVPGSANNNNNNNTSQSNNNNTANNNNNAGSSSSNLLAAMGSSNPLSIPGTAGSSSSFSVPLMSERAMSANTNPSEMMMVN